MRVSDIDYRDYCPVEESEQYELERDEIMFAAMQPTKGATMHPVEHAKAVEAAKRCAASIAKIPACHHEMAGPKEECDVCRAKWEVSPVDTLILVRYILSTPGPSRDAELREFIAGIVEECGCVGEGNFVDNKVAELRELTAAIGGRDDVQAERERCLAHVKHYWRFDDNQHHRHTWHEFADCVEAIHTGTLTIGAAPTEPAK